MGRSFARFLHCLENRTLAEFQPHVERHHKQQQRQNERQAPCPGLPCFRADDRFCPQYYKNGQNKAARDACLDETGKITASVRSEEHTSELQSILRISYAVFCLKKKKKR